MCEPTIVLTGVTTALSMAGQFVQQKQQAKQASAAAAYNAQVASNDAAAHTQLAQNEISITTAERENQQRKAAREMGAMRAEMGASGLQVDSGTRIDILGESAMEHQHDSNIITQNGAQAVYQHQVAATKALNDKNFAEYQGANAGSGWAGTALDMGGSLLTGLGKGIGQYKDLKR